MPRQAIVCHETAPAVGPFAAAVRAGELLFVSGQVGQDPVSGELIAGDVAAQAAHAFVNIRAVLRAAGKTLDDVVRVGV